MVSNALVVAGSALLVLVIGVLIRFGRVTYLIASVGFDDDPPDRFVDVIGNYTILVGLALSTMAALAWNGTTADRLWTGFTALVVASAIVIVAWANTGDRGVSG